MERSTEVNKRFLPFPLEQIQPILLNRDRFVFLETQKFDRDNYLSYLFLEPVSVIACFSLNAIRGAFQRLESFLDKGYWAAGFFSYEMGYGWEKFRAKERFSFPLIRLGIFNPPLIFNHLSGEFSGPIGVEAGFKSSRLREKYQIKGVRLNQERPGYIRDIGRIKDYIARGFTYQVNYTLKCKFRFEDSAFSLYRNLRNAQPVSYAAFMKDRQLSLLSFSPELFFRRQGRLITVKPMKGTIARGRTGEEDRLQAVKLRASAKDRSENVMIVDLLRNDLGRVSEAGSVNTVKLYTIEKYRTLFQMTSTIQSRLRSGIPLYELFGSIFPSGSVTGAPKIETMDIIRGLEKEERKVYTGSIGFFKPNRDAVFNVAIRTILLEGNSGEMGIGSGIVYDSRPEKEYKECELKALFFSSLDKGKRLRKTGFTRKKNGFQLIETMRWSKEAGFFLLPHHLARLQSSARYFNFRFNEKKIKQRLKGISRRLGPASVYRVRLLLSPGGNIRISYGLMNDRRKQGNPRISFAEGRINSRDVFLYHKTTNRLPYDREYEEAKRRGIFDVIFENERGEVTEGSISNIFVRQGKMYYTPPVSCGLLDGIYRQYFIRENRGLVEEKVLMRSDLYQAEAIYLTNSVRGITRVRL